MNIHAARVIETLGGTAAVARIFGLSMPSVSDWKKDGIPRARMMYLQAAHKKDLSAIDLSAATSAGTSTAREPSEAKAGA